MKTQDNRNNLVSIVPAYLETASPQRSSLRGLFTVSTTRKGKCRPWSCGSMGIFFFFLMCLVWTVLGLCCCEGFSLVVMSGGHSLVAGPRVSIAVVSLAANDGP